MLRNPLERATHPSQQQIRTLLEYIEQHPEIAKGFPKLPAAKNKIKKQWEQLAPRLNKIGKSVKTWQQWTKYWADKKSAVKKKAALRDAALKSGSDPDLVMELSDLEKQIVTLMSQEHVADTLPPMPLSCENSCSDIDVTCTSSGAETHLIDNSEVVLLMSPTTLVEEASLEHQVRPASPHRSSSPERSPSPLPQQGPYRSTFGPVASSPPQYHDTEAKYRRRGRILGPPPIEPSTGRRSQFSMLTERFLRVEEQRLELDRRNASILETVAGIAGQLMERDFERERVFAQALSTVGDGLRLLAETLRKNESMEHT